MKQIYAIKERLIYIFAIALLSPIQLVLLIKFKENTAIVILAYTCVVFVVLALLKLFSIPYHIVVNNDRMKVFDYPLLATNKFLKKRRSLILWNSEINLYEVEKVELVKLTKDDKIKYVGHNHLFNRYIKVSIRNSSSFKYVYVSNYSNSQIKRIISILTRFRK